MFIFYRRSPQRRAVVGSSPDDGSDYLLYGLDEYRRRGIKVSHNLEPVPAIQPCHQRLERCLNAGLSGIGARGGDFASVLAHRNRANKADLVLSTVDTLGFPVVLLRGIGLIRRPVVYVSIGLPERIMSLNGAMRQFYRCLFRKMQAVIAYGHAESAWIREWLQDSGPDVSFVPFGVDTTIFSPANRGACSVDVLSIGADAQRDNAILMDYAEKHPGVSLRIITTSSLADALGSWPANTQILKDVPFAAIRGYLSEARVVALPVKENTYSGATTTLLQAMSMAKPVVVSNVGAIREGYGLRDSENCLLVQPGDGTAFAIAIDRLLSNLSFAEELGRNARLHVSSSLSWSAYVENMMAVIVRAVQNAAVGPEKATLSLQ
jgi:glycosyltransferase involved in cell wall biosynthesis